MSKKRDEFIAESLEYFQNGPGQVFVTYYQRQPYTMCELSDIGFMGLGFSKVCFPDKWDEERGKELALQKAVADCWRQRKEC